MDAGSLMYVNELLRREFYSGLLRIQYIHMV